MSGRKVFKIHSILGLVTGVLILVISISGSILVFSEEIDHALNTEIVHVQPGTSKASLDTIFTKASGDFPGSFIRFRKLPQTEDQAIELSLERKGEWTFAYYDPYTGKLLGSRNAKTYLMGWMLLLHYSLLGGIVGELLVGILSVTLLLSIATGIYVYRKHFIMVMLFQIPFSFANWRKASSSLHRFVGVWSLIFNIIFAVTGFWMMHFVFIPSTYTEKTEQIQQAKNFSFTISLDSAVKNSSERFPGFIPAAILLPETKDDAVRIYGKVKGQSSLFDEYSNFIELDQSNLKELKRLNIAEKGILEKWDAIDYTLHSGHWGNLFIKVIYCIAGLSPGLLSLTGFLLWYRRKKKSVKPYSEIATKDLNT